MSFETTLPRISQVHLTPGLVVHFKDLLGKRGRLQRLGWRQKNVQYRYMPQMHQKRLEDFWCMNSSYDYYIQGDHGSAEIVSTKPLRASCIRPSMSSISMSTFSWSHLTIHMSSIAPWLFHLLQPKKDRSNSGSREAPPSSWHKCGDGQISINIHPSSSFKKNIRSQITFKLWKNHSPNPNPDLVRSICEIAENKFILVIS